MLCCASRKKARTERHSFLTRSAHLKIFVVFLCTIIIADSLTNAGERKKKTSVDRKNSKNIKTNPFFPSTRQQQRKKKPFQCTRGKPKFVRRHKFCDGMIDCSDGSDEIEINCTKASCNKSKASMTSCDNASNNKNLTCMFPTKFICNKEVHCVGKTPCTEGCSTHFVCPDGQCMRRSTVCNADTCDDCKGFSRWRNGHGFKCSRNGGNCVLPQILLYDGVRDCDDGSDLCYAEDGGPLSNFMGDVRNSPFAKFNTTRCFHCLDKSMIVATTSVCDGIIDCPDMTDECLCDAVRPEICKKIHFYENAIQTKRSRCHVGDLICSDGSCVKRNKVCDGIVDCKDAFDEKHEFCRGTIPCKNATIAGNPCRCSNMAAATCVQRVGHYCNEQGECMRPNFKNQFIEPPEDECQGQCYINRTHWSSTSNSTYNCSASIAPRKRRMSTCWAGTRKKPITKAINQSQICDGVIDCPMSLINDENKRRCRYRFFCRKRIGRVVSIARSQVCDGFYDCGDRSDERNQMCRRKRYGRFFCSSLGGLKNSIAKDHICDFTINCDNQEDERNCSTTDRFYCENKQPLFVRKNQMFNGLPDCTDWSDECPTEQSLGNGDIFSSKYELIANPILRVVVWIMGIVALGGNLGVFINEVHFLMTTKSKSASLRANHMLVLNLSIADTLMGIYLVILGAASIKYHGVYCAEDHAWRASNLCVTMGVIVVLASETSVMTMVLLTIFRLYAVYKPLNAPMYPKTLLVVLLIFLMWTLSFLFALMPLLPQLQSVFTTEAELVDMPYFKNIIVSFSSFQTFLDRFLTFVGIHNGTTTASQGLNVERIKYASSWMELEKIVNSQSNGQNINIKRYYGYYSANSVCIPQIFVTTADSDWVYSFLISFLNFVAFTFVTIAYVIIYKKSSSVGVQGKTKSAGKHKKRKVNKKVKAVQRKIFRLILTDFCCWVPISVMAFLNLAGVKLSPVSYAVAAIILLPTNSALNPIVYTDLIDKITDICLCRREQETGSYSYGSVSQETSFRRSLFKNKE